ncbi:MAG: 4'-phosphopantetheinyl transferase family protein [Polyangiales bacterium]
MERVEELEHGLLVTLEVPDSKRETTFDGGRVALSRALAELGAPKGTIGVDDRGAPIVPAGFVGSVSHKGTTCVALASIDEGARIGVDLERVSKIHPGLERKILVPEELKRLEALPEADRVRFVLSCFSVKEAIYKAIDPFLRRYVGFHEALLTFEGAFEGSSIEVQLALAKGERPPVVSATLAVTEGRILATARARMP